LPLEHLVECKNCRCAELAIHLASGKTHRAVEETYHTLSSDSLVEDRVAGAVRELASKIGNPEHFVD
jgi:uncharacterized protein (UPF0179 family)